MSAEGVFSESEYLDELVNCIHDNRIDRAKEIINIDGINFNKLGTLRDMQRTTALRISIFHKNLELVELLVNRGADVNFYTKKIDPGLFMATFADSLEIVKFLVEKGGNVNHIQRKNYSLLHVVCLRGNLAVLEYLFPLMENVNHRNFKGNTPVLMACMYGNWELVKYLVKSEKVNIGYKSSEGKTLIHYAFENRDIELMTYLLRRGANINQVFTNNINFLFMTVFSNDFEMFEFLIRNKINLDHYDIKGNSVIHLAVLYDRVNFIKYLIEKCRMNMNLPKQTFEGETPLILALKNSRIEIVNYLIEIEADNYLERNILKYCTGTIEMWRYILEKKSDLVFRIFKEIKYNQDIVDLIYNILIRREIDINFIKYLIIYSGRGKLLMANYFKGVIDRFRHKLRDVPIERGIIIINFIQNIEKTIDELSRELI